MITAVANQTQIVLKATNEGSNFSLDAQINAKLVAAAKKYNHQI
jgi:hypothetical protein